MKKIYSKTSDFKNNKSLFGNIEPKISIFRKEIPKEVFLYHGTSSLAEKNIDQKGFIPHQGNQYKEIINHIIEINECMGIVTGGCGMLMAYARPDIEQDMATVSFFAQSFRAHSFARQKWVGGEMMCGIRSSVIDLEQLLTDELLRANEINYSLKQLNSINKDANLNVKLPSLLRHEQWDELSEVHDKLYEKTPAQFRKIIFRKNFFLKRNFLKQIENINLLREKCSEVFNLETKFKYGLIYQIKLTKEEFMENFFLHQAEHRTSQFIEANKISGKYIVKLEHSNLRWGPY